MSPTLTDTELTRAIVRGERPLSELDHLGVTAHVEAEGTLTYVNARGLKQQIAPVDLARGLQCHRYSEDLRVWSFVIESADFWELQPDDSPEAELVLNALWSASFGDGPDDATWLLIDSVVRNGCEVHSRSS